MQTQEKNHDQTYAIKPSRQAKTCKHDQNKNAFIRIIAGLIFSEAPAWRPLK